MRGVSSKDVPPHLWWYFIFKIVSRLAALHFKYYPTNTAHTAYTAAYTAITAYTAYDAYTAYNAFTTLWVSE